MSQLFFNSQGEGKTLTQLGIERERSKVGARSVTSSAAANMPRSPEKRSRSPRRHERHGSPQTRREKVPSTPAGDRPGPTRAPRPLSFSVFIGNKPMSDADSIVRDPDVAVEFARQIFPPEVQQEVADRPDYEVFRDGVHGALKGLYSAYEVGMRLRAARKEIAHQDGRIRNLERRLKEAEDRAESESRKARLAELKAGGTVHADSLAKRAMDHAIADRDTAAIFAREAIETQAYNKGFFEGRKIGIDKTKDKLAEDVCRCENRGYKHGWIDGLRAAGVEAGSHLYGAYSMPFEAYDAEKTDDEEAPL